MFTEKCRSFISKHANKKTAVSIFLVLTIRWGVAEAYRIPSESMNPTLKPGDFIVVNKAQYGVRVPFTKMWLMETGAVQHGDVVVFKYPKDESTYYVKRVVGLPGDRVFLDSHGQVFINDRLLAENYIAQKTETPQAGASLNTYGPITVPSDQLFVLGDNRENSADSRVWGFLPKDHLMGKVAFKWFSWVD